ncbi:MAG: hypothetical protein LC798_13680 [Chloroflexi bacterium]|nr:hypothetical protein [Chloroflexota bacterium]
MSKRRNMPAENPATRWLERCRARRGIYMIHDGSEVCADVYLLPGGGQVMLEWFGDGSCEVWAPVTDSIDWEATIAALDARFPAEPAGRPEMAEDPSGPAGYAGPMIRP